MLTDVGEEPVARSGFGPGRLPENQAVEGSWPQGAEGPSAGPVGCSSQEGVAGDSGSARHDC